MKLFEPLLSRRSLIASIGAFVLRMVWPGSSRGAAPAASTAQPSSAAPGKVVRRVERMGQTFYYDGQGRVVKIVTPAPPHPCTVTRFDEGGRRMRDEGSGMRDQG